MWVICGRWFCWRIFVRHFVVKVFIVSKIICFHSYTYGYKTGDWEIFCELCEHQHTLFHAVTILSKCCPFIGYALFDRSKSKSSTYRMIFWNVLLLKLFNFSYNKEKMLIYMGQNSLLIRFVNFHLQNNYHFQFIFLPENSYFCPSRFCAAILSLILKWVLSTE